MIKSLRFNGGFVSQLWLMIKFYYKDYKKIGVQDSLKMNENRQICNTSQEMGLE